MKEKENRKIKKEEVTEGEKQNKMKQKIIGTDKKITLKFLHIINYNLYP